MINTSSNAKPTSSINSSAEEAERTVKTEIQHAIQLVSDAGRKVNSFIHSAGDEISHVSEKATTEIRANPVRSSLIALGAGFVLSALLRR